MAGAYPRRPATTPAEAVLALACSGQTRRMRLYAELPAYRTRQLTGDVAVLAWTWVWVQLGRATHAAVARLGAPGRELQAAGEDLSRSLGDASRRTGELPLVGDSLAAPLEQAGEAARRLAAAGAAGQSGAERLALLLGLAIAVLPVAAALLLWIPRRLRWVRQAAAAERLTDADPGLELLALRALVTSQVPELMRAHPEPASAVRRGDADAVARLAALELARLGLRAPPTGGHAGGRAGRRTGTGRADRV